MVIIKVNNKEYKKIINKETNGLIVSSAPNDDAFVVFICVNNKIKAKCICTNVFSFKNSMKDLGINEYRACALSDNIMSNINKHTSEDTLYCWVIKGVEEYKHSARVPYSYTKFYSSIFKSKF